MSTGYPTSAWLLSVLVFLFVGCSSSSDDDLAQLQGAVQDLTADPDGLTTRLSFQVSPGAVQLGEVQADGGQNPLTVTRVGSVLTVIWDARVTPSHRVRVLKSGVDPSWRAVTTSDPSVPTFSVTNATQDTSDNLLGGDTIELTFSGPRVVETDAEDVTSWELTVNGTVMDLTGSVLDLNPATQVLTMTLGTGANLHATFNIAATSLTSVADVVLATAPVAGAASGDAVAPTLTSVVQRVDVDEFGRMVEFTFDEPMDPVFSTVPARFSLVNHPAAQGVTLVIDVTQQADPRVLRVTFSRPVAPGFDQIAHSGLMDAHGNVLPANTEAFTSTNAVNAFDTVTATTTAGSGGDVILITTDQAFDPDFADDPARWSMVVAASTLTMADQTLVYDYLTKTLTVTLDFDMRNGDLVVVDAIGQVDVDGQAFTQTAAGVTAGGDATVPTLQSVVQNRTVDATGHTVDVLFSEDMHQTQAEDVTNYTFSPVATVSSATLTASSNTVRVVVTDLVLTPGDVTLTVDTDLDDLAGNTLGGSPGPHPITSTDTDSPAATSIVGNAVEGADDDTIVVLFDDDMIEAEVESEANWSVESPVGTPYVITGATIDYDAPSRTATVTLDAGGQALKRGNGIQASFVTMRDIGGNAIVATAVGGPITFETDRPTLHSVWRADAPIDDQLNLRFSEPCDRLTDLYDPVLNPVGTRFAVRDSGGLLRGYPVSATVLDGGLGVRLSYGFQIALTDELDVIGVTDLAGNPMFPALVTSILAQDPTAPAQGAAPIVSAVSGELNDTITIDFSTDMSPWRVTDPVNYTVRTNPGGVPVALTGADIAWGGRDTVTITLLSPPGENLQAALTYDVTVNVDPSNPLRSKLGVPIAASDTQTVAVSGDNVNGPTQGLSLTSLDTTDPNSLIVVFDEAVDETAAELFANYDYDVGNVASAAQLLSPRVLRATFGVAVQAGRSLVISPISAVDLAGNSSGGNLTLSTVSDTAGPLLGTVAGNITVGQGGDRVVITFNEQIDLVTGLDPANYTVNNGGTLDISAATISWDSVAAAVSIALPVAVELDSTQSLSVQVANVRDASGNPMSAQVTLGGPITGDDTAPDIAAAWTNYQAASGGTVIEVLFTEDVDSAFAGDSANWSTTGTATVDSVTVVDLDHVQLQVSAALGSGVQVSLVAGLEDLARNAAPALSEPPVDPAD